MPVIAKSNGLQWVKTTGCFGIVRPKIFAMLAYLVGSGRVLGGN